MKRLFCELMSKYEFLLKDISEIAPLKENLENIAVNDRIFHMKKREALKIE